MVEKMQCFSFWAHLHLVHVDILYMKNMATNGHLKGKERNFKFIQVSSRFSAGALIGDTVKWN